MKPNQMLAVWCVAGCTLSAYGQLDPGDCGLRGLRCARKDAPCTTSDGMPGVCRQETAGCHCAPHNVCHWDQTRETFGGIVAPANAIPAHLAHGDCLIDDGVDCTIDRCNRISGCVHTPDDSRCEDGLFCTTDTCTDEGCEAVTTCPPSINGCVFVNDSCDEANNVCVDRLDHSQCDDGDACTSDTCDSQTGDCINEPLDCDDGNPCTDPDYCDPDTGGCVNQPVDCDDSDACTSDTCSESTGECEYTSTDCDDGNLCTIDDCDPDTGCTHRAKCDDANLCTSDNCNPTNGQCIHFETSCVDLDPCTTAGFCDPATGQCVLPPMDCDDDNLCTTDRCQSGTCVYTDVVCDDGIPCTDDFCEDGVGCAAAPKNCNDGNPCNGGEICHSQTGQCVPNPISLPHCNDGNACTQDVCEPATGGCSFPPRNCDDGNGCTIDTCSVAVGCQHEEKVCPQQECIGTQCDPATGGCGPVFPVGTACDDGNECTFNDSCFYGNCNGTPCSGGQTCCPGQACVNLANDNANCGACGNVCESSVCFQGTCFDGCVIGGVAYNHGVRNPNNECQACNTGNSRTSWTLLGGFIPDSNLTCSAGCGVGFCILGGCDLVAGSSGCHNTTCATSTCVGGQCVETPRNEGAACTPALSTESCVSSTQGICQAGTCVGLPSNVGGFCVPGEPIPFADDECYSQTRGICDGSGHCLHTLFLGSPCTRSHAPVVQGCSWGQCDIGETGRPFCNINNGGLVTCPRSQACGGPVLEDLVTCECIYPDPGLPSGEPPCQGSEDCCPGQVCICDPHDPLGWCFNKWCWNLADLD